MSQPLPFVVPSSKLRNGGCLENYPSHMKKIPNSDRRLGEHISRAMNKIRKPSTAGEITELLNRDLDQGDRPFQETDVADWLQNAEDTALTLYWSNARPQSENHLADGWLPHSMSNGPDPGAGDVKPLRRRCTMAGSF